MGWISWLCPGINLKRWLLLFAVGVLLCALGLALFFNYQLMGKAEELLFQMTYLTTGRYSNGLIMTMGVGFLIVGFAIMVYGTRRLISSVVSVVVPDKNGSLMETIFMQRKLPTIMRFSPFSTIFLASCWAFLTCGHVASMTFSSF